jgi:hypothetical protein
MLAGPMFGREFWVTVIDEFERSALTQARFARQRGVPVATLRSWLYRLRRERKASVSLVPVRVVASTAPVVRAPHSKDDKLPCPNPRPQKFCSRWSTGIKRARWFMRLPSWALLTF